MKTIIISVFVVGLLFYLSSHFNFTNNIISPQSDSKKNSIVTIDDPLFLKYKNKVEVKNVDVKALGNGKEDLIVGQSANYIAVDGEGKVVVAYNPDVRHAPASLTKIMTSMVTLDIADPSDIYTVPSEALDLAPTVLLLDKGEKLSVNELMTGALITSANDAAYVLAYETANKLGGSYQLFVKLMNEKAKNLGLTNTHFTNATGYDNEEQYTTPRDLAVMTQYALAHYPEIKSIVAKREVSIPHTADHKVYELPNWNALLGVYPGVYGVKIGHTDQAGHSTIVTSTRNGKKVLVVLLGAPDIRARDMWTAQILNSAFGEFGIAPYKVSLGMLQTRSGEWGKQLTKAREESIAAGENVVTKVDMEKTREE